MDQLPQSINGLNLSQLEGIQENCIVYLKEKSISQKDKSEIKAYLLKLRIYILQKRFNADLNNI